MQRHPAFRARQARMQRQQELIDGVREARARLSPEEFGEALHGMAVFALATTVDRSSRDISLLDSDEPVRP